MGRYFGREPRYSQEEAEAQARDAIDAAVKKGRPPGEDWKALGSRMGDVDREVASRPPEYSLPPPPPRRAGTERPSAGRPRVVSQILRPPAPAPEPAPTPAPTKRARTPAPPPAPAVTPAKRAPRAAVSPPAPTKRARTQATPPAKRAAPITRPPTTAVTKRPPTKKRPE